MDHREPLERWLLVVGVMVDKGVGVLPQPGRDEVDGLLEHSLFGLPVMCPKRGKSGLPIVGCDEAEQVFETATVVKKRIPLHIKEDVAQIGLWQPGKSLSRSRWKQSAL